MKYFELGKTGLQVSNLAMGCMRIDGKSKEEVARLIETAMEEGINFFDHADIYGGDHACERHFAESLALTNVKREDIIIQTKCGIRPFGYDFSRDHILKQADDSLKCLNMDYLDVLLLHRPDALMEPDEVAEAFDRLHSAGKVRFFGVSNHNPMQIRLLEKSLHQKLQVNQLQMGIAHTPMIDSGMAVNMAIDQSINRDGSVLDYCRLNDITIQAWSPFQKGFFEGVVLNDNEKYAALNEEIRRLAAQYEVAPTAIAVAFLTRHPANIQVILGTTSIDHMRESCAGASLPLTREEWYGLYKAAGNMVP